MSGRLDRIPFLMGCMTLLAGAMPPCHAQVSSTINSNLEQTAGTSSTRRAIQPSSTMARPVDFDKLRISPGDVLEMNIFGIPEMTRSLQVDDHGDAVVPLAGSIHLADVTAREGAARIRQALIDRKMFNNPEVSLEISEFTSQSVTVSGEVQSPGRVDLLVPKPLLDVLALAGGETTAAGGDVYIHHPRLGGQDEVRHLLYSNKSHDPDTAETLVYPGDTVDVKRAGVIYVLGAVSRPGGYLMVNAGKLSVPEALSLANGTTQLASTKKAVVVRRQPDAVDRIEVPLDDEQRGRKPATELSDGDILYVSTSRLKASLASSSQLITTATGAVIYGVAAH